MFNQKKIQYYIQQQDILNWIILIHIFFYLVAQILKAFHVFSLRLVALPPQIQDITQIWRLFSYGIFHQGFIALFFNMLLLFYFGSILLDYRSEKRLLWLYITGILSGGIFFLISYRLFPGFYVEKNPLLGASAGVMAVITYIALLLPAYQIKIRFLGHFKLLHLLLYLILFNLLQIPLGNPGGYFAHLGGLTAGFIFYVFDRYLIIEQKDKKSAQKSDVDTILDKISRSGYESLTKDEKETLFRQSKK